MPEVSERVFSFSDDVMFKRVMHDPEICKGVIERVIDQPVGSVDYTNTEQQVRTGPRKKVIQTDSYLVESAGRLFDVEMQVKSSPLLPLRFRGYQSVMDSSTLWSGDDYDRLKESYIIFICTHDPFKTGLPVYTLERTCMESADVDFDCRAHWIVLNSKAYSAIHDHQGLRSLLRYVETGEVSEGDGLVERIDGEVARNNADESWVSEMMSSLEIAAQEARVNARWEGREEGREEGRKEGREEGRAEGRAEGRKEVSERYAKLIKALSEEGRLDDLGKAASDPDELRRLFDEFRI